MAESLVTSMSSRYFCHKCNQEINPVLPEFKCPGCREGFIEEVSNDATLESSSDDSSEPSEMYDRFSDDGARVGDILRSITNRRENSAASSQSNERARNREQANQEGHGLSSIFEIEVPIQPNDQVRISEGVLQLFTGEQQGSQGNRSNRGRGDGNRSGIWEMAIPYFQILHGNPGDYAWGSQGLDAIITQLLNSIESSGPPPMPKEEIDKLPTIKICQEDVDKNLQCTVCMEDYKLDEPVRVLSCNHVYHNDCIVPWLEMHGTCPICRKILIENQQSQRNCENRNNPNNQQPPNQRTSNSNVNNTSGYRDLLDYD